MFCAAISVRSLAYCSNVAVSLPPRFLLLLALFSRYVMPSFPIAAISSANNFCVSTDKDVKIRAPAVSCIRTNAKSKCSVPILSIPQDIASCSACNNTCSNLGVLPSHSATVTYPFGEISSSIRSIRFFSVTPSLCSTFAERLSACLVKPTNKCSVPT